MNKTYLKAVLLSVGSVSTLAIIDILAKNSGLFTAYYTGMPGQEAWWPLYKSISLMILVSLPLFYYFLVKQDKSESFALFFNSWILWQFGLEDLLYYIYQWIPLDASMPWLNGNTYIHGVSTIFGQASVTSGVLIVSVMVGFALTYLSTTILYRVN